MSDAHVPDNIFLATLMRTFSIYGFQDIFYFYKNCTHTKVRETKIHTHAHKHKLNTGVLIT